MDGNTDSLYALIKRDIGFDGMIRMNLDWTFFFFCNLSPRNEMIFEKIQFRDVKVEDLKKSCEDYYIFRKLQSNSNIYN